MSVCGSEDSKQKLAEKPFFHHSKILGLGFCWECIKGKIILTLVEVERKTLFVVIDTEVKPMEMPKGCCSPRGGAGRNSQGIPGGLLRGE